MNTTQQRIGLLWLIPLLLVPNLALAQSASDLLQDAIFAEDIEGDLDKAIGLYNQVAEMDAGKRPYKAQALFRKSLCHLKKNEESEATATLQRLLKDYDDQTRIIEKAQVILKDLSIVDPASLFPPKTLMYAEIGSPGKQIETILNLLTQGGVDVPTMLQSIGGNEGDKSPSEMVSALLNPSMMEELKKIRGMAVGMIDFRENNDGWQGYVMLVLYPGESDAFRGFLEAGIRMAAKADEAVHGMETLTIQKEAYIGLDDKVILISQTREQLEWAIGQYKSKTHYSSLAKQESFFRRASKKDRQDNTFTVWMNSNDFVQRVTDTVGLDELPDEFHMLNGIVDFKSMDETTLSFSIKPDGLSLDVQLNLTDEHQCLPFSLIHTPNMSAQALQNIPEDAILLASLALGEINETTTQKLETTLSNITGLDIGREIFSNLEQINLFAVRPDSQFRHMPPQAMISCVGLAMTSHNPQQTRILFQRLLGTAHQASTGANASQSVNSQGLWQYKISVPDGPTFNMYLGQKGKTTVLSLNPDLNKRLLISNSIDDNHALRKPINTIAPSTSKLICANIGGLLQLVSTIIEAEHHNPQNPGHKAFMDLAQACAQTTLQLRTDEGPKQFRFHISLEDLPGIDSLVRPAMRLGEIDVTGKVKAQNPNPKTNQAILSQNASLSWKAGVKANKHKLYFGTDPDALSFIGETKQTNSSKLKLPSLESGNTYIWRVDEVWSDSTVITGDTWKFQTAKTLAHYMLDGNAQDSSSNQYHGSIQGNPTWIDGPVGKALMMDGEGTFVSIPANMSAFDQGLTFALWAKPMGKGNWERFIEFGSGAPMDNINFVRFAKTQDLTFEAYDKERCHRMIANGELKQNTWHHYAVTCDAKGQVHIYRDGKQMKKGWISAPRKVKRTQAYLGKSLWEETALFKGAMDDVRIYPMALNPAAIKTLYGFGKAKEPVQKTEKQKEIRKIQ